ncbi:MAG: FAD-dependent oxidoreductase [Solirubrobacteraceae bacterium]
MVVLGGGFGGMYTALHLERLAAKGAPVEVSLVNRENYLVFQPMLAEVIAGDVGILDTVSPLRQLLPNTQLFVREIEGVDMERRVVKLGAGLTPQTYELAFDHLVVALGNVTDFRGIAGLPEHALPFKTLADSVRIRNHVINVLEQASVVTDVEVRRTMLTFVVAGGGFSGTEVAAALNDFVRDATGHYRSISREEVRIVLVHSGKNVLDRELTPRLARYSTKALTDQGIELLLGQRLVAASPHGAVLSNGQRIATRTLISTVPSSPNPIVGQLGLENVRGRLECDATLAVKGSDRVWAAGDCAQVPMPSGEPCPPTAQHAIRQAKVLAANIVAGQSGAKRRTFAFKGLGKLGALGHHRAVAELPGGITVEGVTAWLMWRGIYWVKLPGAGRKTRVAISWLSDMVLASHPVQLNLGSARGATQAHYEADETVFEEGDAGDSLLMILSGQVEVIKRVGSELQQIRTLGPGEYFGEMALLGRRPRSATTRALTALDLLVLPGSDFTALANSLGEFRGEFEQIARSRAESDAVRAGVERPEPDLTRIAPVRAESDAAHAAPDSPVA